ncbi:hypothetical protein EHQ81_00945 [Leptospira selangorensis]|uniref:Uncharacterized protein n=1 Tax=Leptospira selangorensis TaxID=2484982 RepID=A0A5F2C3W7_9LEPT|nr:hypothetical protein [Leptospira selangorensis]TGM17108.1 hypothetical protein EHQ81_00945 [Leptospira selangorensis]TGM21446.1 hypothetical protein EHQ82_10690 [Leptospira selangorensis]
MKVLHGVFFLFLLIFSSYCSGAETLIYRVERVVPAKERPVFSPKRVEGEDCIVQIFPFMFARYVPDLQSAYNHAMDKSPPGTQSIANGEVYTKGLYLPPIFLFRCIVVSGTPSFD